MYFWQQLTPQNSNITLVCVGDRIIYRVILTCRRFMVKYFNISRALSPFWKLRGKGSGPWVSQNFGQKNGVLSWKLGLVRDCMNCTSLFSSLGSSSSPLWGLAACSSGHTFPDHHKLLKAVSCLTHLPFSCVSPWAESVAPQAKGPQKQSWRKHGASPRAFTFGTRNNCKQKKKPKKTNKEKWKYLSYRIAAFFPVLKRPIIAPSPDWMAAITNSKKYLY